MDRPFLCVLTRDPVEVRLLSFTCVQASNKTMKNLNRVDGIPTEIEVPGRITMIWLDVLYGDTCGFSH
jgi:hypothetical protein